MKSLLPLLAIISCFSIQAQQRTIIGKVTDGKNPIENVNIMVLDTDKATATDADGRYEIAVETGDKVRYSYTGLRTIEIRIEDVTRVLNPIMIPEVNELDEVKVTASTRRSQKDLEEDYRINKNIIRTAFGYVNAEAAAGRMQVIDKDEIYPIYLCVLDLARVRFPGVIVTGNCASGGSINVRGSSSFNNNAPVIYDIDGMIFTDTPVWFDVNNAERIALIQSISLTVPYGFLGAGGVMVINTKLGTPAATKIVDRARLRNNFYDGEALGHREVLRNAPSYLSEFNANDSFEASKVIFQKHQATYSNSPYFLLDAYRHFVEEHDAVEYADGIIDEHFGRYANNPVLLKSLAYIYESQGRYEKANETYKDIFIQRPNYVQSYRDMANSYRAIGEPKQAAAMYARYEYLIEKGFLEQDTIGFGTIIEREFNNLLMLNRGAIVDPRKAQKLFLAEEDYTGTRLVFEWNDGEAEFELQFVNPENQYEKWKHSLADNPEVIEREKDFGYNVKEFLVDGSLPGTWQVNMNYLGNKSLTPTYLKVTIMHNYGTRAQREEVKVFKLHLKNVNKELFKLNTGVKLVSK